MNSEKVEVLDSGSSLDYGSYTMAGFFLDSDVNNSAKHRFKEIDVWNPDYRIGENEKKKKKKEVLEPRKAKEEINMKEMEDCESNVKVMLT